MSRVLDSDAGQALKKYLLIKLEELRSIDNIALKDTPTHQTIELKAQKKAHDKLKEILSDIMTIENVISKRDPRDSYVVE